MKIAEEVPENLRAGVRLGRRTREDPGGLLQLSGNGDQLDIKGEGLVCQRMVAI